MTDDNGAARCMTCLGVFRAAAMCDDKCEPCTRRVATGGEAERWRERLLLIERRAAFAAEILDGKWDAAVASWWRERWAARGLNSAKPTAPVNNESSVRQRTTSDVACADVADSNDPRVLIKVAHQHWYGIGWPEDTKPIALLERAMELLNSSTVITNGKVAL